MFVGIDIEEVCRFQKIVTTNHKILNYLFTNSEIEYSRTKEKDVVTLTGLWCAKEAIVKAFSQKGVLLKINQIEIAHNHYGVPILHKIIPSIDVDYRNINLSISHTKNYAVAICIIF